MLTVHTAWSRDMYIFFTGLCCSSLVFFISLYALFYKYNLPPHPVCLLPVHTSNNRIPRESADTQGLGLLTTSVLRRRTVPPMSDFVAIHRVSLGWGCPSLLSVDILPVGCTVGSHFGRGLALHPSFHNWSS